MIGGAKGIGIGIDFGIPNQYCRATSKPYIEKDVLDSLCVVASAYGKSNNDPDRAVIKNLVDPDNPFVISNAAYKLNSGYGKYEIDFDTWLKSSKITSANSESFNFTTDATWTLLYYKSDIGKDMPSFKVHIKLEGEGKVYYNYVNSEGVFVNDIITQEEYVTPISYNTKYTSETPVNCGFTVGFISDKCSGTITQIPSYQGAFVTDGVDDLITSTKTMSEMLGGSNEITVVSMIHQVSLNSLYNRAFTNYLEILDGSAYIRNDVTNGNKTGIYGYTSNLNTNIATVINNILGDKSDYSSYSTNIYNYLSNTKFSVVGRISQFKETSSVAWYWTFIAKKKLTTDEINQVIAYYNLDKYVKPDIYYDIKRQGLSNDTPDADWYLKDFSGNGRDMQLYNFAKKLGSGIGKYNEDFSSWSVNYPVATFTHTSDKIHITSVASGNGLLYTRNSINTIKVKVTGVRQLQLVYRYILEGDVWKNVDLSEDGIYELPASVASTRLYTGFSILNYVGNCNITIEQIPDYEGALVFDAVEDYGQYVGDLELKDYTVAVDRAYAKLNDSQISITSQVNKNELNTPFTFETLLNGSYTSTVAYSFGNKNETQLPYNADRKISYQSKYVYDSKAITSGNGDSTGNGLTFGCNGTKTQHSALCLWSFMLFSYSLSEFLLERQLKRYKLGTLYPDMVEWRPKVNINVPVVTPPTFSINNGSDIITNGQYISEGTEVTIRIFTTTDSSVVGINEATAKINGVNIELSPSGNKTYYAGRFIVSSKQNIDITIDEYIRYEDIIQPYPAIINLKQDGKTITWGDKLKVGSEVTFVNHTNLLPDLYTIGGGVQYNGTSITWNTPIRVEKSMVFTNIHGYKKDNEPNCILSPQTLRIPNASYKILGYIPDLTGKGNHGKINNSAYAGMSGANGYKYDYKSFLVDKVLAQIDDDRKATYFAVKNSVGFFNANSASYKGRIKLTGVEKAIKDNFIVVFQIYTNSPTDNEAIYIYEDGIYDVNIKGADDATRLYFFALNTHELVSTLNTPIVIEQIGEYEGSFCLDGVDDFITIPTLSHGAKQVLMKVNYKLQNSFCTIYDQRNPSIWKETFCIYSNNEAIAYSTANSGKTYIDGILNTSIEGRQLANITHNITIANEDVTNANSISPKIGTLMVNNSAYAQMALFSFMSFDEISSEDEIKELNDIVGIEGGYVESPDYYWDAYGKANRATQDIDYMDLHQAGDAHKKLIDKSIAGLAALKLYHNTGTVTELNNRLLNANNFAFNEESGYDGWLGVRDLTTALNYMGDTTTNNWKRGGTLLKDRDRNSEKGCGYAFAVWFDKANYILKFKVKITGLTDADELYICQYNIIDPEIKQQLFNGINEVILDLSASIEPTYQYISFRYPPLTNDVDFEFLYEYQNGLVSDGVDDHLINTVIPEFNDFTVIAKRQFLNSTLQNNETFCLKGDRLYSSGIGNAFLMEYNYSNTNNIISFGEYSQLPLETSQISYITPTSYNGNNIIRGTGDDNVGLMIGKCGSIYWKGVFYKMMLYSKTIDMLSINMLKNLFAKDELIDVNNPIFKK